MRRDKLPWNESRPIEQPDLAEIIGALAEMRDDGVLSVEDAHARFELRDYHQRSQRVEVAWITQARHKSDVPAIQREGLDAVISAVGHRQDGRGPARVHPDSVRLIELSRLAPQSSEGADVAAFAVILIYVARSITVADIDIAVRRDRQVRRRVRNFGLAICRGFFRIAERKNDLPF